MPDLLALVPCERVIIDEQTKVPTLVVILEKVDVQIPEGSEVPNNLVIPKEWAIFTMWGKKGEEEPGHYKQIIEIVAPGSVPTVRLQMEFDFAGRIHKLQNRVNGFPAGGQGVCWVKVWLETVNGPATETHSYPIEIAHLFVKPDQGNLSIVDETVQS